MPEYVVTVKSKEVLTGFELAILENKVKAFFLKYGENVNTDTNTEVKAEYR
jgi:hypothetical protein